MPIVGLTPRLKVKALPEEARAMKFNVARFAVNPKCFVGRNSKENICSPTPKPGYAPPPTRAIAKPASRQGV